MFLVIKLGIDLIVNARQSAVGQLRPVRAECPRWCPQSFTKAHLKANPQARTEKQEKNQGSADVYLWCDSYNMRSRESPILVYDGFCPRNSD